MAVVSDRKLILEQRLLSVQTEELVYLKFCSLLIIITKTKLYEYFSIRMKRLNKQR